MAKQSKQPQQAEENTQQEAVAGPSTTAEAPPSPEPRLSVPVAPRGQGSADSQYAVQRIRNFMQAGVIPSNPHALPQAIDGIEGISTVRAHPSVAAYKAECLDYLRGRQARLPKKS